MRVATIKNLHDTGFTNVSCPATRQIMPNMTRNFKGFHISYCSYMSHYGSDTTALVLAGRVFFILNGNHASELAAAAERNGIQGCIELFAERIGNANPHSEHMPAVGMSEDTFELYPTALQIIGQEGIDRIRAAVTPAS
jgi:hypothetical protein